MSDSLTFGANHSFAHFLTKNERFTPKFDEQIHNLGLASLVEVLKIAIHLKSAQSLQILTHLLLKNFDDIFFRTSACNGFQSAIPPAQQL